ncbi:dehydration-responsive element-binding protein 1H-like [Triticum dicoccoides]|uniref:dehydration-responsive element-binding protein 1H-like n=1 Tax=Triticum dicoccoides TaxID=85692 RepID=UPI00189195C4|nr:dehydration-responsive element-binding protein 1H-like [Triticum dicoccoides]
MKNAARSDTVNMSGPVKKFKGHSKKTPPDMQKYSFRVRFCAGRGAEPEPAGEERGAELAGCGRGRGDCRQQGDHEPVARGRGGQTVADAQPAGAGHRPRRSRPGAGRARLQPARVECSLAWVSEIRAPGQKTRIWLGSHSTAKAAARAYDATLLCLKGASAAADVNFPVRFPFDLPAATMSPKSIQRVGAAAAAAGASAYVFDLAGADDSASANAVDFTSADYSASAVTPEYYSSSGDASPVSSPETASSGTADLDGLDLLCHCSHRPSSRCQPRCLLHVRRNARANMAKCVKPPVGCTCRLKSKSGRRCPFHRPKWTKN